MVPDAEGCERGRPRWRAQLRRTFRVLRAQRDQAAFAFFAVDLAALFIPFALTNAA
jgi:hypothetical protein